MCSTCGCGQPDPPGADASRDHELAHAEGRPHEHAGTPGARQGSVILVEEALLAENDRFADYNRGFFDGRSIRCLNLISAPGAGKTTLLERTLLALRGRAACTVIEGDQTTEIDAQRIARTGVPVTQIQTGRSCHLDAHQVQHALERLSPPAHSLLFIENVGNLICPTEFRLGEHERVVVLSVAEGTDKPAKYPLAFRTATALVIAKTDLLPHVDFDVGEALRLARGLNPGVRVFQLSAKTGEGMEEWLAWLLGR